MRYPTKTTSLQAEQNKCNETRNSRSQPELSMIYDDCEFLTFWNSSTVSMSCELLIQLHRSFQLPRKFHSIWLGYWNSTLNKQSRGTVNCVNLFQIELFHTAINDPSFDSHSVALTRIHLKQSIPNRWLDIFSLIEWRNMIKWFKIRSDDG